jgi:hypothetical protein
MKIYIWQRVNGVSTSYHDDGGFVAVAESLEAAREMSLDGCAARTSPPDAEYELTDRVDATWFVFPDAGCC